MKIAQSAFKEQSNSFLSSVFCFLPCRVDYNTETIDSCRWNQRGNLWKEKILSSLHRKRPTFLLKFPLLRGFFSPISPHSLSPGCCMAEKNISNSSSQLPSAFQLMNTRAYCAKRRIIKNLISKWSADENNVVFNLLNLIGKWEAEKSWEKEKKSNYRVVNYDRLLLAFVV